MNVYVIFRETEFESSAKKVFDSADLLSDAVACRNAGLKLWPGDPIVCDRITYRAMILPAEEPVAYIELVKYKNAWLWQSGWSTYDYMGNYIRSMYECGSEPTHLIAAERANESYERLLSKDGQD